jgi:hypothetical protein
VIVPWQGPAFTLMAADSDLQIRYLGMNCLGAPKNLHQSRVTVGKDIIGQINFPPMNFS